ncbi:MAG: P-loop NTPase [Candidatus Bathyarchaeia archaeon]
MSDERKKETEDRERSLKTWMAIRQFLADVVWGDLEFLVVDLPPGTGDEALSIMQLIPDIDGAVIGVIENMSGYVCPKCGAETDIFKVGGGQKVSEDLMVPFLGKIPIDPEICEDSDNGVPFIVEHTNSPAAKGFMGTVIKIEGFLKHKEEIEVQSHETPANKA